MSTIQSQKNYVVAANTVELISRATAKALTKLGHGHVSGDTETQNVADVAAAKIQVKLTSLTK